ncbi:DUF222 domain-containing protein [Mycolicibacterium thermoresistibile]
MFEAVDRHDLAAADTAALVATITAAARAEAAAAETRLAAIAELLDRNLAAADPLAVFDGFAATAAEVGAALGISARRAGAQIHLAKALRQRLPGVAELLRSGAISERIASVICWRTYLVAPEAAAAVDAALVAAAEAAGVRGGWGRLSDAALEQAIDSAIAAHDPDATRKVHQTAKRRDIQFGKPDDRTGTTSLYGSMHSADAALLDRTIDELVSTVCPEDPRTVGERRSDAMNVLTNRGDHLPCRCNRPECRQRVGDAEVVDRTRASSVVIHVLADQDAIEAAVHEAATQPSIGTPWLDAQQPPTWIFTPQADWTHTYTPEQISEMIAAANPHRPGGRTRHTRNKPHTAPCRPGPDKAAATTAPSTPPPTKPPTKPPTPSPTPPPPKPGGKAVVLGGPFVPGPLLAELVRTGAKITALESPPADIEPRYRPSATLARFVRARDMTCCFPGCNAPAERCDIDHRIPWPNGPTHAGNTGCFCRTHHLAKTFAGWQVAQAADGTLTWTSPHGARYRHVPGAHLIFPEWNTATPVPQTPATTPDGPESPARGLGMPRRRRTRADDEAGRIKAEREANRLANLAADAKLAEVLGPLSGAATTRAPIPPPGDDPPPF